MLIDGLALPLGARLSFALAGPGISYIGTGRVAYRTEATAGVVVDGWDGAPEALRALIVSGETISGETSRAWPAGRGCRRHGLVLSYLKETPCRCSS